MDGKETTMTIPMKFDKAVRNLANQTLVIEIEASTAEKIDLRAHLNINALDALATFNRNNSEAEVKRFEVPVIKLR